MPKYLRLGDVILDGFDAPDDIKSFGGIQQLAVLNYIGSDKVVQVLGPKPHPISWTATLLTKNAQSRARLLDSYRIKGDLIELAWGDYLADVIIKSFSWDPKNEFDIPYTITLEVVKEKTSPSNPQISLSQDANAYNAITAADTSYQNLLTSPTFPSTAVS